MGTAEIISFPRMGTARKHHQGDLRRPQLATLQQQINAAARKGHAWGVQDTAPWVALAFLAGAFVTLVIVRWL